MSPSTAVAAPILEVPETAAWRPLAPEELFEAFNAWVNARGLQLYPAQEDAVAELADGHHVIMSTPTGSGKSMVALAAHFFALTRGERSVYTAPIKALVSEKFFSLVEVFGAANVGMVTGDSSVNAEAPIICCTAEILANEALREGADADVGPVIMDEFHFYADPHRGWAWQVPLIELPQAQFLLMSATLGDTSSFQRQIAERTGRDVVVVSSASRPVPLSYQYSTTTLVDTLEELAETQQAPVYVVHFSQRAAAESAAGLMSLKLLSKAERELLGEQLKTFRFAKGYGQTLSRLLKSGVGVHHAGMLPKYRRLVEQLSQQGLLKVISGTDTLGVGINVPIRTVLLTGLSKYDGIRVRQLNAREFHQIAGRAGRAGFDTEGTVVVQAPEHVIENESAARKLAAKHAGDEAKLAQAMKTKPKKKPPEGFVSWSEKTFERIIDASPEPMVSRMQVTYAMVLHLLNRPDNTILAARRLITSSDETPARQAQLQRRALQILRELLAAGVLERLDEPDADGRTVDLQVELQDDFALNQPLAPFAVAALDLLDPESETYALDVISVIESILETPHQVTGAQVRKLKGERIAELKAEGVDYTERMRILDEMTHPQPLAELLQQQFEVYRAAAPWAGDHELAPKSVVRDMIERAFTFVDAVNFYGLARSEGVLLRYLSDAYRTLSRTVPATQVSEELEDLIEWLGEVIRQTDSSLLEEWERLAAADDPQKLAELQREQNEAAPQAPPTGISGNERAFGVLIRNAMFRRAELFANEREEALAALEREHSPTSEFASPDRWAQALDTFFDEYDDVYTDAKARSAEHFRLDKNPTDRPDFWHAVQVLDDDQGNHDWVISAWVDLAASDEAEAAVIAVDHVGELKAL
ncbi:superfamily II RNA helicase [Garicola koreensis]|uniref:Superfamily II RNA helicase n=1 Tax=Garicola koreensis TaxID=1262554 RepID=A0A7W5TNR2_9MICC|nr:superfamily II RNA helicase [Garicola koreensis]